jgi:acid stress-induced BolA-like protein IbaG/YrbA
MSLRILSSPPPEPEEVAGRLRAQIEAALPDARVEVEAESPGHFSITVESASFEGLSRVKQQQRVYAAIRDLMAGDAAPVHAVDRMVTRTP